METRFRWLQLAPFSRQQLNLLAGEMQTRAYSRNKQNGFVMTTVRSDSLEGIYIERFQFVETLKDPLGGEISVNRVEFRRTEFRIATTYPQLELRNPGRSVKVLLTQIASALDHKVAITSVEITPLEWVAAIERDGKAVTVLAVRTNRFQVSNAVSGSIQLVGTQDVRKHVKDLLGKRQATVDGLLCGWSTESGDWRIELRLGGSARILSAPDNDGSTLLRRAISKGSSMNQL